MGVREFAQDMGAQNLALRLVAATDPKGFAEYRAQSEGLSQRQKAALRSVAGVVAFGGLLDHRGQRGRQDRQGAAAGRAAGLRPADAGLRDRGAAGAAVGGRHRRRRRGHPGALHPQLPRHRGAKTEEVSSAAEVFDLLAKNGATAELQQALFRDASRGLLYHVHACDPRTAGQMLDTAVPAEQRAAFARELNLPEAERFNFVNGFVGDAGAPGNIAEELLGQDHRPRLADRRAAMTAVQLAVAGRTTPDDGSAKPGFLRWNNEQLMRLVFVNRDGSAAQFAAMEVAGCHGAAGAVDALALRLRTAGRRLPCAGCAPPKVDTAAPARPPAKSTRPARPARPAKPPVTPPKKP